MKTCQRKPLDFPYALRSFIGYLEGTEKAEHTVKNYRLDLLCFESFLKSKDGGNLKLTQLQLKDLERFHDWLKAQGLKTNTRRRRLITVRRFLGYLAGRGKVPKELLGKVPTPQKLERIPKTVIRKDLVDAIRALTWVDEISERSRALLWVLAETGCLVSEVCKLRFDQFSPGFIVFEGKAPRSVQVSPELIEALTKMKKKFHPKRKWMFTGFNRFTQLAGPISPRGIEMLVRSLEKQLGLGKITPRTFRHSTTHFWLGQGLSRQEVQKRLGLKSAYAFRGYDQIQERNHIQ